MSDMSTLHMHGFHPAMSSSLHSLQYPPTPTIHQHQFQQQHQYHQPYYQPLQCATQHTNAYIQPHNFQQIESTTSYPNYTGILNVPRNSGLVGPDNTSTQQYIPTSPTTTSPMSDNTSGAPIGYVAVDFDFAVASGDVDFGDVDFGDVDFSDVDFADFPTTESPNHLSNNAAPVQSQVEIILSEPLFPHVATHVEFDATITGSYDTPLVYIDPPNNYINIESSRDGQIWHVRLSWRKSNPQQKVKSHTCTLHLKVRDAHTQSSTFTLCKNISTIESMEADLVWDAIQGGTSLRSLLSLFCTSNKGVDELMRLKKELHRGGIPANPNNEDSNKIIVRKFWMKYGHRVKSLMDKIPKLIRPYVDCSLQPVDEAILVVAAAPPNSFLLRLSRKCLGQLTIVHKDENNVVNPGSLEPIYYSSGTLRWRDCRDQTTSFESLDMHFLYRNKHYKNIVYWDAQRNSYVLNIGLPSEWNVEDAVTSGPPTKEDYNPIIYK